MSEPENNTWCREPISRRDLVSFCLWIGIVLYVFNGFGDGLHGIYYAYRDLWEFYQ